MTTLVIGGPGSGKSALAEELAVKTGDEKRYYLATMAVCDADGAERVKRHRSQREGKGFVTIEREMDLPGILPELEDAGEAAVLIECVANLVGNEMQRADKALPGSFADELMSEIRFLADHVRDLIIVTDEFEKESGEYDASTRMYVRLLDLVNEKLLEFADVVYDLRNDSGRHIVQNFVSGGVVR